MTTEKLTVDSSVLIALLKPKEFHHGESVKFMNFAISKNALILLPTVVLFEVFHNLRKQSYFDKPENYEKFKDFFNLDCFIFFDLNLKFFNFFKEFNFFSNLKTADAIIAGYAHLNNAFLISWDKRILKETSMAFTPKDFLDQFS